MEAVDCRNDVPSQLENSMSLHCAFRSFGTESLGRDDNLFDNALSTFFTPSADARSIPEKECVADRYSRGAIVVAV